MGFRKIINGCGIVIFKSFISHFHMFSLTHSHTHTHTLMSVCTPAQTLHSYHNWLRVTNCFS